MITLQMIVFTVFFLGGSLIWFTFFFRRVDPWLRRRIGAHYGVTIDLGSKGLWKVRQKDQGARGFLIEFLQIVFVVPAAMVPLFSIGIMMLLASSPG